jgi:hypothetical protein
MYFLLAFHHTQLDRLPIEKLKEDSLNARV